MKPFSSFISLLLLLASCSQESVLPESPVEEIRLSGGVVSSAISGTTRGVVDKSYFESNMLSVSFARIDQNTDASYPAYTTVSSALSATRSKGTGQQNIGFASSQFYLTRSDKNGTRFIGWYPQVSKGSTYANGVVTFDISTGVTDVMLTSEVEGNKVDKFGTSNRQFTFSHLLTQVTVKTHGDAAAKDNWGDILSIKVKGCQPTCKVALSSNSTVTFPGNATDLLLRKEGTDDVMAKTQIPNGAVNATTCGYAMFPPTEGNSLILKVTTERGGEREVPITLQGDANPAYFAAGTAYTITLIFSSTTITPSAEIVAWRNGGNTNNGAFPYQ